MGSIGIVVQVLGVLERGISLSWCTFHVWIERGGEEWGLGRHQKDNWCVRNWS